MNSMAASSFGTVGKNLLKMQDDAAQLNCHVSSVIYKIRDHGPAILDGEFYKDSSNAVSPAKASCVVTSAPEPVPNTAVRSPSVQSRAVNRVMLVSIVLLAIALSSVAWYAYQQQMYVSELQAAISIYDAPIRSFE